MSSSNTAVFTNFGMNFREQFFVKNSSNKANRLTYNPDHGKLTDGSNSGCPLQMESGNLPFTNEQVYWDNEKKTLTVNFFSKNDDPTDDGKHLDASTGRDRTDGLYNSHLLAVALRMMDRGSRNTPALDAVQKMGQAMLVTADSQNFGERGHKYCFSKEEAVLEYDQADLPTREEWLSYWDTYLAPEKVATYTNKSV